MLAGAGTVSSMCTSRMPPRPGAPVPRLRSLSECDREIDAHILPWILRSLEGSGIADMVALLRVS